MKRMMLVESAAGVGLALVIYVSLHGMNLMPILFLGGALVALIRINGPRGLGTRPILATSTGAVPNVCFDEVGGQSAAKKELREAIEFLSNPDQMRKMGIRPLKGILLTGPPGTGKTLLAKAAAHYTGSVFLATAGSDFVEMYAGVGAQRVRSLFRRAREEARRERRRGAVIFIDEIDVLGARRGSHGSHMEYDQTLNALLVELDGLVTDGGVQILVMAATNRVEMLDHALLRPGRFDRVVQVELPDREGRLAILRLHTRTKPLAPDANLEEIARQTFGFSGAHLEALANEAAILALRAGHEKIGMCHLVEAVDKVMLGERIDHQPMAQEKWRVAVHEAGHALVGEWVSPGSVSTITITPRGRAMGYVRTHPPDDRYLYTRPMLEAEVCVALAGFLAEELLLGEGSTGAANDFSRAAECARRILFSGLSDLGITDQETLGKGEEGEMIKQIIRQQQERVRNFLQAHGSVLEQVATMLNGHEVLSGDALRQVLAEAAQSSLLQGGVAVGGIAEG